MRIITTCLILFFFIGIHAQSITSGERKAKMEATHQIDFRSQNILIKDFFDVQKTPLGFNQDEFKIKSEYLTKSKKRIVRHTQYHKDIEIIGGSLILHTVDNKVLQSVGQIVPDLDLATSPSITGMEIQAIAAEGIQHILTQDEIISEDFNEPWHAHHAALVIMDKAYPNKSGDYRLAYQCDVHSQSKEYEIFIDAHTAEIIAYVSHIHSTPIEGEVETNYYGTQSVTVDQVDNGHYELHDETRGNGIYTFDAITNSLVSSTENNWDASNPNYSKAAGDVHYGTTAYYDYMLDHFGWSGLDGNDGALISYVNVNGKYYANAYWNGVSTNYGNGNCERYNPLTSIDIVGHEWTHGFVDYSSDLIYYDQSGALNESSADIFGKALEFEYDPQNFSWNIGQHMLKDQTNTPIRSMSDPNSLNDPAYYGGQAWYYGAGDNAGVHSNSGVFNYWFYLLVEGVSGINEKDYVFNVPELGMEKTIQIVFYMNVGYLTENSNYFDAMYASLSVCDDLYGVNSTEREAVLEAWRTVGLYPGIDNKDLTVRTYTDEVNLCPSDDKYLDAFIYNVGNQSFDSGTTISVSFKQNNTEAVDDEIILTAPLMPGDSIYHQFTTPLLTGTANDGTAFINILSDDDLNFVTIMKG